MHTNEVSPRNRAERRSGGKKMRAAGAALTAGSAALAMGAAWVGTGVESAHAASTFTVTQSTDDGTGATSGSLSWAITQANGDAGSTIAFNVPGGTITLSGNLPASTTSVAITGPGPSALTIDGSSHRVFDFTGGGNVVTVSGLTITHGSHLGLDGGAIQNGGDTLTVSNVALTDNSASYGGAISSGQGGSLDVESSVLSGNTATDSSGGAIGFYQSTSLTINNSQITDNSASRYGGGLYVTATSGAITISGSTFSNNAADDAGGGLMVDDVAATSAFSMTNTTVSGNSAPYGGGIDLDDADGGVSIADSQITGNHATDGEGGGLYADGGGVQFDITNTNISNNDATRGGAGIHVAYQGSDLNIVGSTISGNAGADGYGGGVQVFDYQAETRFATSVSSSTISGNSSTRGGAGLDLYGGSGFTMTDSTVSGNTSPGNGGGIDLYLVGGTSSVFNSTITGNTSGTHGGGISFTGYYGLDVAQATIAANTAATSGGIDLFQAQQEVPAGAGGGHHGGASAANAHTNAGPHHKGGTEAAHAHATRSRAHASAATLDQVTLSGTIVALNAAGDIGTIGAVTSTSSIVGSVDAGTTFTDAGGNQRNVDPMLGPLANNGGPTETMALLFGSPAIDAGPATVASFPGNEFDQRGPGFARVVNGTVDVGAFEVQPAPIEIAPKFTG